MLTEVSEIIGLQVYTKQGTFLGNVNNVIIDVDTQKIDGVFLNGTNPLLVEGGRSVSVPYRWIQCIGDIILLRYFPKKVRVRAEKPLREELLE